MVGRCKGISGRDLEISGNLEISILKIGVLEL
jgi:hypothetical protein